MDPVDDPPVEEDSDQIIKTDPETEDDDNDEQATEEVQEDVNQDTNEDVTLESPEVEVEENQGINEDINLVSTDIEEDINQNTEADLSFEHIDDTSNENPPILENKNDIEKESVALSSRKCDCGARMLSRIAEKLRVQASTLKLSPQMAPSNKQLEDKIVDVLNTTLSVLQTEMANLMETYVNIDDTVCTYTESQTISTHIDSEQPSNSPGDDINVKQSAVILCECHPTHAGAAPPTIVSHHAVNADVSNGNQSNSCPNICQKTTPDSANSKKVVSGPITQTRKCGNKTTDLESAKSSNKCYSNEIPYSRIPVLCGSGRLKTETSRKDFSKTCCSNKGAGVQTILTLGKRLQSESLSSLSEDDNCRITNPCEKSTLCPSESCNIKLSERTSSRTIKIEIRSSQENLKKCTKSTCTSNPAISFGNSAAKSCLNKTNNVPVKVKQSSKSTITITISTAKPRFETKSSHSCPNVCALEKQSKNANSIKKVILEGAENLDTTEKAENDDLLSAATETEKTDDILVKNAVEKFSPAKCTCTNNRFDTFKADPVMVVMETCETELRPLRRAFNDLQQKVRELKVPELKGCFCETALEPNNEEQIDKKPYTPHCARFTPAKFVPLCNFPYGKLPFLAVPSRPPIELSAPHFSTVKGLPGRRQHHPCCCKPKKSTVNKKDKETQHRARVDRGENTPPKNVRRPIIYQTNIKQNPFANLVRTCDEGNDFFGRKNSRNGVVFQQNCCRKLSTQIFPKTKRSSFSKSSTTRLLCCKQDLDVQNLQKGQAVKTDPEDFNLPKKPIFASHVIYR